MVERNFIQKIFLEYWDRYSYEQHEIIAQGIAGLSIMVLMVFSIVMILGESLW